MHTKSAFGSMLIAQRVCLFVWGWVGMAIHVCISKYVNN